MNRNWMVMMVAAVGGLAALSAFGIYDDVTLEKYPDADSVLVDSAATTEFQPDGSFVAVEEQAIKILTEKGRIDESTISVGFNRRYGVAEIVRVSAIGPDGVERAIDVAATTKETTDNASASENIYDPEARKVVCSVPGLKVGDVLKYATRRQNFKSRVENQFADIAVLEWAVPMLHRTITFIAPKERPLVNTAVRHPLGNVDYAEETLPDGRIRYTWTVTDAPQAFEEPDMPPFYTQVQHVRVSTAKDWPTLSKWYWDLSVPHLEKTTAGITNKVEEILAATDAADLPRIKAIYKWVAQEIRYMGLTMEDTSPGYAPHDVEITFSNRYGVCRDKAALLVAMLRIAGLEAYPVLIHAGAKMDREVPQPYFNHAIVAVRAPGSAAANGSLDGNPMKVRPRRLITPTGVPSSAVKSPHPRPGCCGGKLAGRRTLVIESIWPGNSFWSQVWSPEVKTSTEPGLNSRSSGLVMPLPPAMFSPLATQKSMDSSCRSAGTSFLAASRPPCPTMSPMKRSFSMEWEVWGEEECAWLSLSYTI